MHMKHRDHSLRERGQVIVLFALLVPVIFAIGSVVMGVGNWYVLKRHLQTQVDAAALAGGPAFTGCFQDPSATNDNIRSQALEYAGDTLRDPTPASTYNLQLEEAGDQRVVINSDSYWSGGATDGAGYDFDLDSDGDSDSPCNARSLDVKVTDDKAPLLFRWIPLFPSLKARAKVEISKVQSTNGVRPVAVPEVDMEQVAVLFVNEDGVQSDPGAIRGSARLTEQTPSPSGLEGLNVWLKDNISPVALNGNNNFGVIVVASRSTSPISLTGSISAICNQNPETFCYAGGTLGSGLSFIHAYSTNPAGTVGVPRVRDVSLGGGCAEDLSAPYFNLTGGCPIGITATIDFGMSASSMVNAANHPTAPGICARVNASPGGAMQWIGTSPEGWSMWGNVAFTPAEAPPGGRTTVDLSGSTDNNGNCGGNRGTGGTFGGAGSEFRNVAKPYVATDASGPVQYLRVETSGGGLANSRVKDSAASLDVVVGLTPLLRDRALTDPPLRLRVGDMPNSMTLRCDGAPNQGKSGWEEMMRRGCAEHQIYDDSKHPLGECKPRITPDDCVDSKPGNFSQPVVQELWGQPNTATCADTPNNWDGVAVPDSGDPRWIPLFIVDPEAGDEPNDKTFPIRRFGMFYVTAAVGLNCPGDNPPGDLGGKRQIWGHFASYITPGFGSTVPSSDLCSFTEGGLCVSNLVE
jgi:hypothetical protein